MNIFKKYLLLLIAMICMTGCGNNGGNTTTETNEIVDDEVDDNGTYTILVYMVGSDLESGGQCTSAAVQMNGQLDFQMTEQRLISLLNTKVE